MVKNSDNSAKSDNKSDDLEKFNDETGDKKKKAPYKSKSEKLSLSDGAYFQKLKSSYEQSKQAKRKVEPERQDVKSHLQRVKQQLKECANEKDKNLLTQDLAFFKRCLPELKVIEKEIDKGLSVAKRILETGVKQSYALLVDFKRVPCPSERALEKGKNKGNGKQSGSEKGGKSGQLGAEKLNEMRGIAPKGQPVASPKNADQVNAEEKTNTEGVDKSQKGSKGERKTLADYKKEYGFTRSAPRLKRQQPVQNINILDAGRDGGR